MPLLIKKYLDEDCLFGLWRIDEDYDTLLKNVILVDQDINRLNSFRNERRRIESLSVRALLAQLTHPGARIVYDERRKPFLLGSTQNISISHSKDYTAIILSKNKRIGVDLEYMSHDIAKAGSHFLNKNEYITDNEAMRTTHLYIHWCAKEALYKICDKKDIVFNANLTISPFEPLNHGKIQGVHHLDNGFDEVFDMTYWVDNGYVIVCCVK